MTLGDDWLAGDFPDTFSGKIFRDLETISNDQNHVMLNAKLEGHLQQVFHSWGAMVASARLGFDKSSVIVLFVCMRKVGTTYRYVDLQSIFKGEVVAILFCFKGSPRALDSSFQTPSGAWLEVANLQEQLSDVAQKEEAHR